MEIEGFALGQLVYSKAGRDAGRALLVVGFLGDRYVLVADGEGRKIQQPKKKNVRHLQPVNRVHAGLAAKLARGDPVTDEEVRAAIAELTGASREGVGDDRGEEGRD